MIIPVQIPQNSYDITLERGAIRKAGEIFNLNRKVLVVTDSGVPTVYADTVCGLCKTPVKAVIPEGEASKNLDMFQMLCKTMLENGFTRKDCVVAVGGGVVGDLAGFAAASFMRGVDFYNIPTTLLSQVDSSVGGKTAVDFCGIKNIIGAFYQPKAVIIDPDVLDTLDKRQFACGAAEIIKMAACMDKEFFDNIAQNGIRNDIEYAISGALRIKAYVVSQDEKEASLRKVLNFGHTLGHGIESVTDLYHGECVAIGMLPMCSKKARISIKKALEVENLPSNCTADIEKVVDAVMHDKKSDTNGISCVLVDEIGKFSFKTLGKQELIDRVSEVLK
ncbi:MAG: 3-dehydroquinate synthase [Clostridia bacterium]|nr:3-dehydroquinate synthase [Clostridia bacterium]